jgi:hypothetical protein
MDWRTAKSTMRTGPNRHSVLLQRRYCYPPRRHRPMQKTKSAAVVRRCSRRLTSSLHRLMPSVSGLMHVLCAWIWPSQTHLWCRFLHQSEKRE